MKERRGRLWIDAAVAGGAAGILAEVMVYRLNPEVTQAPGPILVGVPLWATWGAIGFGLPLLLAAALVRRLLPRKVDWWLPEMTAVAYLVAAMMSNLNSGLHEFLLSPSAQRVMQQDAAVWVGGVLLAVLVGSFVRRRGRGPGVRYGVAAVLVLLPLVRLLFQTTPPGAPLQVEARPIGVLERRLVVVGVEGLDLGVLLGPATDARFEHLTAFRLSSSWGPMEPHRPHLRRSAWTSLATGTYPERHGLKSHWAWLLPWQPQAPLRLLPWTPSGSRLILPWGLAERVTPPPASVPPLWERIRLSGATTAVFDWPGEWPSEAPSDAPPVAVATGFDPDIRSSLQWMLDSFPDRGAVVREAVLADAGRVAGAVAALAAGVDQVWLLLDGLSTARKELEPLKPRHTREREVIALALQVMDDQLGQIVAAAGPDATVALVTPYGLAPPDSWERLQRLLGARDDWRASAEACPPGVVLLKGPGVIRDRRLEGTRLPDLAPTLCYLVGLPVAQYMQGRLMIEAVDPAYLANHPLRVVD